MQALVMEIDLDRVDVLQDAVHRAIVEVEEAQGALVAGLSLEGGRPEKVDHVQDIDVDVDRVDAVGDVDGQ